MSGPFVCPYDESHFGPRWPRLHCRAARQAAKSPSPSSIASGLGRAERLRAYVESKVGYIGFRNMVT